MSTGLASKRFASKGSLQRGQCCSCKSLQIGHFKEIGFKEVNCVLGSHFKEVTSKRSLQEVTLKRSLQRGHFKEVTCVLVSHFKEVNCILVNQFKEVTEKRSVSQRLVSKSSIVYF